MEVLRFYKVILTRFGEFRTGDKVIVQQHGKDEKRMVLFDVQYYEGNARLDFENEEDQNDILFLHTTDIKSMRHIPSDSREAGMEVVAKYLLKCIQEDKMPEISTKEILEGLSYMACTGMISSEEGKKYTELFLKNEIIR